MFLRQNLDDYLNSLLPAFEFLAITEIVNDVVKGAKIHVYLSFSNKVRLLQWLKSMLQFTKLHFFWLNSLSVQRCIKLKVVFEHF